ncbi:MAG TPA: bifunctional DNA-formamidopyrimidine glycosylase/DNA-(apurinic or apyrimidinic site) lyase [Steroidobacteraceae bacterium]|nr:bifunctional DNA-formamidopyrimidine glycosylase/DNA-(apurinic or apyrimidinic site) lyase [Steroidobacteraceae bacterium]
MPELPEVETTRRGIEPHLRGHRVTAVHVYDRRLRWPVTAGLDASLRGQRVRAVERRAKYLLLRLEHGTLILHLGMSGNLRVLPRSTPRLKHDHLDLELDSGQVLRLNDPRRFGSCLYTTDDPARHPLLRDLAPEPLEPGFDGAYLHRISRRRRVAIKLLLLNGRLVTGVGNIYASEALFRARIRPRRAARSLDAADCARLAAAIRRVLGAAIRVGGTTLRDYVGADGEAGYFRQKLYVYERAGLPCRRCRTPIRRITQGQRSTYYCPQCQR